MEYYLVVAKDQAISPEEIGAVQAVAMAVSAGRVNAQLREVERRMRAERKVTCQEYPIMGTVDFNRTLTDTQPRVLTLPSNYLISGMRCIGEDDAGGSHA